MDASAVLKQLASLAERVQVLEDERGVLATLYRYCRATDGLLAEEWADCFTEDGAYELRSRHRAGHRRAGRAALVEFVRTMKIGPERVFGEARPVRREDHFPKHLCVDPRITITGDTATAESYFAHLDEFDGAPVLWTYGVCRDQLVRCADGGWRFTERIIEQQTLHPAGQGD